MLTVRRLGVLIFYGAIMATGTLSLLHAGGRDADHAATLGFTTFVLYQLFNLLNVRSEGRSAFNRQIFTNYRLWVAVALVAGMQQGDVHHRIAAAERGVTRSRRATGRARPAAPRPACCSRAS